MILACVEWTKQANKGTVTSLPRSPTSDNKVESSKQSYEGFKSSQGQPRHSHCTVVVTMFLVFPGKCVGFFFSHFMLEYILITPWTKPLWPKEDLFLYLESSYGDIRTQHYCHICHWWARATTAPPGGTNTGCSSELSEITAHGTESLLPEPRSSVCGWEMCDGYLCRPNDPP